MEIVMKSELHRFQIMTTNATRRQYTNMKALYSKKMILFLLQNFIQVTEVWVKGTLFEFLNL